ncbi:MAG: hypothetical protein V6Z89_00270 [Desulfobacter sp.]
MPYSKVQFIAYALNSAPLADYHYGGLHTDGLQIWDEEKFYLGSRIASRDIKARIKIMFKAIDTAYKTGQCDMSSSTLKIFMAPEFFFRGILGAYSMDDAQTIIEGLRQKIKSGPYRHWIFVFGTTVAFSRGAGKHTKKEVYNFSVVQKGNGRIADSRVVMKEFKSGIDFIGDRVRFDNPDWIRPGKTIGLTDSDVKHLAPVSGPGSGKERQRRSYDGNGIFELDGITFGMEVCLDHLESRLRKSPQNLGENMIQIQLIPSAGMEIKDQSIVAMKNGLVFNCDGSYGLPGKTPVNAHSILGKVKKMHVGTRNATWEEIPVNYVKNVDPVDSFNNYFAGGPGEVHIYPSQRIPKAVKESLSSR